MAHTKAGGKVKNGRDSAGQRLGVKCYANQTVTAGSVLVRQKGMEVYPGKNASVGKDHTVFATAPGTVKYSRKHKTKFNNHWVSRKFVEVVA